MEIRQEQNDRKGIFYVGEKESPAGKLIYHLDQEGRMVIEHTEVGESLAGQGAGRALVTAAVDYARSQHLKVIPLCPYAHSLFRKKPEWKDLLP